MNVHSVTSLFSIPRPAIYPTIMKPLMFRDVPSNAICGAVELHFVMQYSLTLTAQPYGPK